MSQDQPAGPVVKSYRSLMYGDEYTFRYVPNGSGWKVEILSHPSNPRGGSCHQTHILAGNILCVSGVMPTLQSAIAKSLTWVHYFSNYIRTGSTTQPALRIDVNDKSLEV